MVMFVASRDKEFCPIFRDCTRSTISGWVRKIASDKKYMLRYTDDVTMYTLIGERPDIKLVALGEDAAKEIEDMVLPYFKLPDPSPKNDFLKKKVQVDAILEECKQWLK